MRRRERVRGEGEGVEESEGEGERDGEGEGERDGEVGEKGERRR